MDRVLVVDDDPGMCQLIEDILSEVRMSAVCVRNDRDAYKVITTLPTIQALVVDVNLGAGTTGFDVARFARQVVPDLPVIYVSGEASEESFEAFGVPDSTYVPKPFGIDDFVSTLLARIGLRYTE